jgi:transcriptional regulator with XRE-family HTH domain
MRRAKRTELAGEAKRLNRERLARIGAELRVSRKRRRARQADVGRRAGLSRSAVGSIEHGYGGTFSADSLQAVSMAVGRRLDYQLSSDALQEPADAGHLAIQELVLRLGRAAGFARTFELPTRPADPARSADVGVRDDRRRFLVLVECWNTIGDVGAASRSSERKLAEAEQLAVAIGPLRADATVEPYRVRGCWVVRATARNRALLTRYPEVFAARFPGSSAGWVRALAARGEPQSRPGLVWCDVAATRLFAWRQRR